MKLASFESLRILFCTGAVLTAPMFEWTQNAFGGRIHLISGSGGTDICTGCEYHIFSPLIILKYILWVLVVVSGIPTLPVYAGGTFFFLSLLNYIWRWI